MLWLIFCRHGVIHTQSLQKLLLEDDVTKPAAMTVRLEIVTQKKQFKWWSNLQQTAGYLRINKGYMNLNVRTVTHTVNPPCSVKLIHALQRLDELQDLIPLAIQHQLSETNHF